MKMYSLSQFKKFPVRYQSNFEKFFKDNRKAMVLEKIDPRKDYSKDNVKIYFMATPTIEHFVKKMNTMLILERNKKINHCYKQLKAAE